MKRTSQKGSIAFVALTLTVVVCVSCSCETPKPAKEIRTVVFITNTASDFWSIARKGCEKADEELEKITVVFRAPTTGTTLEQDRLILDAVNREKADALAISPVDPVAQKRTINMAALRAVVMTQDSDAPDTNRVLYIGANNREAGRQAGELLKSALPNGGKVMAFVGRSEVQNAKDRFEGIKEAIAGSKIEILGLMTDESDLTEAKDNVRSTIKKHSDIAGMVGLWSYNGPAILRAIRDAKKEGSIKIVCFDDDKDTLKGIKDGAIFGTVAQQPYEYGYQAVHLARKILDGDRSVIPESKQVLIPTRVIQKKDVDEYTNKQAKLLGKA